MARGGPRHGDAATTRRGWSTTSRDEVGQLAAAFNRMSAELAVLEKSAPRSRRQRLPRAQDPDHGDPRAPGEPRRRRRAAGPEDAAGDAGPDRAARAAGRSAPGSVATGERRGADVHGGHVAGADRGAGAVGDLGRSRGHRRRRSATTSRRTSRSTADAERIHRCSSTWWTTRCASRRRGARSRSRRTRRDGPRRRRGPRHGRRDRARAPAAVVRALLPRRRLALARGRRDGHRPRDRPLDRREPRWPDHRRTSEPGHGSTFTFDLPAAEAAVSTTDRRAST